MKLVYSLLVASLLAFLAWPYYRIYQIDDLLGREDAAELAPFVELASVRKGIVQQFDARLLRSTGQGEEGSVLQWMQENLREIGSGAADRMIDLVWVRETLRRAARRSIQEPPYYFIRAIDHAFFDGFDSFVIRLGEIGQNPTHITMQLRGGNWKITGIYD